MSFCPNEDDPGKSVTEAMSCDLEILEPLPKAGPPIARCVVDPYLQGKRVDTVLAKSLRNYTTWRLQRIVRAGGVTVDGIPAVESTRLRRGQVLQVRLLEPPDKLLAPEPIPLKILYEDRSILVVDKPPGMIAHPTGQTQTGTLAHAVQHHLDNQSARPGLLRPGIIHRLDRDTSGTMVVARDHLAHRLISISFQRERTQKQYLALVEGVIREDRGRIDYRIGRMNVHGCLLMSARGDAREPKSAVTLFEVVQRFSQHTLVKAMPRTGRLHQIRVHLATFGHPVVADEFYGPGGAIKPRLSPEELHRLRTDPEYPSPTDPATGMQRHALHAQQLAFPHPTSGAWMEFTAPLPADLTAAVQRLSES